MSTNRQLRQIAAKLPAVQRTTSSVNENHFKRLLKLKRKGADDVNGWIRYAFDRNNPPIVFVATTSFKKGEKHIHSENN